MVIVSAARVARRPRVSRRCRPERYPWLLPTVVALAALLIGLFLTSLLRQIRKVLPPPPAA